MRPLLNQGVHHSKKSPMLSIVQRAFSTTQGPPKAINPLSKDFDRLVDHYVRVICVVNIGYREKEGAYAGLSMK